MKQFGHARSFLSSSLYDKETAAGSAWKHTRKQKTVLRNIFLLLMKTKRETLASLERKLKTKNLEKMRQNTGKKFYLQKETDKKIHKHTRDNL